MAFKYSYVKEVNPSCLSQDIDDSSIVSVLAYINTHGTSVDIFFETALSGGDETTLDGIVASQVDEPLPEEMSGLVVGLSISNNAMTPDSEIDISKGRVRRRGVPFSLDASITIDITASGLNGLDTGSVQADTWYAVFVISNGDETITSAGIFSLSLEPDMPSGYCCYRRVGWVKTDVSSNIMSFQERWTGNTRRFYWDEQLSTTSVLDDGSASTFTAVDLSAFMPQTSCCAILSVDFKTGISGDGSDDVKFRITGSSFAIAELATGSVSGKKANFYLELPTDANQSIDYKVIDGANNKAGISVRGWYDDL